MCVIFRSSADKKYEISISPESTVSELKTVLAEKSSIPAERQRIIFSGRILKDPDTLASYKIQSGSTIHLIRGAPPSERSNSSAGQGSAPAVPTNIAAGTNPANPLTGLTGARYAGYSSLPNASMFGPDGGMQGPNTDELINMLNTPGFREQMEAMLSDPALVDMMINSNPQLSSMGPQFRAMLQNPMFRRTLSNPEAIRSMMNMQNMFNGGAGAGGASAFPAPGDATSTPNTTTGAPATGGANSTTNAAFPNANANPNAAQNPLLNPFASLLNPSLMGQLGNGYSPDFLSSLAAANGLANPTAAQEPEDTRPPEERYESQLRQLNELGFFDFDRNVRALRRSGGNVQGAVEALLDGQV